MDVMMASDFLASSTRLTMPSWAGLVIAFIVGWVASALVIRIPKIADARPLQRGIIGGLAGILAVLIIWSLSYYVFNVDLN